MLKVFIDDNFKRSRAGKHTGYRLAYSVRQIKRRKHKKKPSWEVVIKHGQKRLKIICESVKIIKEFE